MGTSGRNSPIVNYTARNGSIAHSRTNRTCYHLQSLAVWLITSLPGDRNCSKWNQCAYVTRSIAEEFIESSLHKAPLLLFLSSLLVDQVMFRASVDFAEKWAQLSQIVFRLIRCESVSRDSWSASFSDVYTLCNSRPVSHAPTLYSATAALISARVKEIATELEQLDDSKLLPAYVHHWTTFHKGLTYLDNLYRFVNQQYVRTLRPTEAEMCYSAVLPMADRHTMEILEVGLAHWKLYLLDLIKDRLSACLVREVQNDRMGIDGQQDCIHASVESFRRVGELRDNERAGMDIYNKIFQAPLLESTKTFYTSWAASRETELACSQYVNEALILREEEKNRALRYYKRSFLKVQALFQEVVVKARLDFINQSVRHLVAEEHKSELRNLFQLLAPDNLCSELSHWFGQHIMQLIREAIAGLPRDLALAPAHFVENLLSIRNRFIQFIDEIFDGMSLFRNQMDKAFNQAINDRTVVNTAPGGSGSKSPGPRPSELLSRYMDGLLRKSSKSSESELESKLTESISIFKYIDEKDVFQKYYQRMLCKRLISNTPSSMELEESVINQLKAVCGYEFTGKFHRMFNDVQLAPELNRKFDDFLATNNVHFRFGHHFNVLTQCSWPINLTGVVEFKLPDELQQCTSQFEAFYAASYQGRKMRWAHQSSTVELTLLFADKPYQIQAPTLHASILLLFDVLDSDVILVRDLSSRIQLISADTVAGGSSSENPLTAVAATPGSSNDAMDTTPDSVSGAPYDQIHRILGPLLEINILSLESADSSFSETDKPTLSPSTRIVLNRAFKNKRLKFRVNFGSQVKETTQTDAEQVERQVNEDRRYFIQAAIVRVMKSRKQIDHVSLIKSVFQQASGRFQPSIPLIKRCVETLIDKGYIERSPYDPDQYNYLA
ncbi:hypothetical protein T265_04792 [Opisthorchis viverrini]|uniref:Cullin family profile domain-containing protein n=1 Tax=Opisthorchis viverrini TaxID=6198 RepID=A0A074ZR88_OPIVI|nr:hypothetical protein T265_04792 [Opisthorchis viverrini]KER28332.1 hypothetical protein T265_04792 [Opisthorchis viverrini]